MKGSTIIAVAAGLTAHLVSAQLENFPPCALTCALGAIPSTGCQTTDIACICSATSFITGLVPCVVAGCTAAELGMTVDAAVELCAGAGVTLSVPGIPGPTATTGVPTTSAPEPTEEPTTGTEEPTSGTEESSATSATPSSPATTESTAATSSPTGRNTTISTVPSSVPTSSGGASATSTPPPASTSSSSAGRNTVVLGGLGAVFAFIAALL